MYKPGTPKYIFHIKIRTLLKIESWRLSFKPVFFRICFLFLRDWYLLTVVRNGLEMKIVLFLISFPFLYRRRIIYAVRKRGNIYGRHSLVSEIFVVAGIQVMIHIIKSKVLFPLWAAKWFNKLFWSQSVTQDFKGEKHLWGGAAFGGHIIPLPPGLGWNALHASS